MKNIGIYVHIPFCIKKCYYCDFISFNNKENLISQYIEALKKEITNQKNVEECKIKTIYIGGGTPSYIDIKYIKQIIGVINKKFNIDKDVEFTIEINPGTVDEQKLKTYYKLGINRLSIGLQSTDDEILNTIGRIHTYKQFLETYKLARKIGFKNINIDLMLGLPNQTIEILKQSVREVIKLEPEHISVYSLILEEGTKLEKKVKNKEIELPNEKLERDMYWNTKNKLQECEYIHYEISNFAKCGYESKHNVSCWNQEEYLGFGLAAHSYFNNIRCSNEEELESYIKNSNNKKINEIQNDESKQKEYMLLGLRKIEGVKISKFKQKFVNNPIYIYREELNKLVKEGLIEIEEDNIKLTNKGIDFANLVWQEFI
ncbi:MAG: radical SAM family heme chaperone HemW [Clostridia bacterium]|nr:radical SAM family heme chaperone HemW [Clostridia bacterium]